MVRIKILIISFVLIVFFRINVVISEEYDGEYKGKDIDIEHELHYPNSINFGYSPILATRFEPFYEGKASPDFYRFSV